MIEMHCVALRSGGVYGLGELAGIWLRARLQKKADIPLPPSPPPFSLIVEIEVLRYGRKRYRIEELRTWNLMVGCNLHSTHQ